MIEIACTCEDLPAHNHIFEPFKDSHGHAGYRDTKEIRIWVDWKAVARELAMDDKVYIDQSIPKCPRCNKPVIRIIRQIGKPTLYFHFQKNQPDLIHEDLTTNLKVIRSVQPC